MRIATWRAKELEHAVPVGIAWEWEIGYTRTGSGLVTLWGCDGKRWDTERRRGEVEKARNFVVRYDNGSMSWEKERRRTVQCTSKLLLHRGEGDPGK